jgi:hypothetical protein
MHQIIEAIPDVNAFLALEPEELASKILLLVIGRTAGMFHPGNIKGGIWSHSISALPPPSGRKGKQRSILFSQRLSRGWRRKL